MIMAMLIIAIASFAMLPILTKPKPQIETVGVRGQFACYYDGGYLKQVEYAERTIKEGPKTVAGTCKLNFNQRPKNYLIIAIGAGSATVPGQVKTKYASYVGNTEADSLTMEVSTAGGTYPTIVRGGNGTGSAEVVAGTGASVNLMNGLAGANIKSCRLLSAGNKCGGNYTNSTQISCSTGYSYKHGDGDNGAYVVKVACQSDENNSVVNEDIFLLDYLVPEKNKTISPLKYGNYRVNLELHNPTYTSESYQAARTGNEKSTIEQILYNIHPQRESNLIKQFINNKYGNKGKNGAVLVLW